MSIITATSDGKNYSYTMQTLEGVNINSGKCDKEGTFAIPNYGTIGLVGSLIIYLE